MSVKRYITKVKTKNIMGKFDTFRAITDCTFKISKAKRNKIIEGIAKQGNMTDPQALDQACIEGLCSRQDIKDFYDNKESLCQQVIQDLEYARCDLEQRKEADEHLAEHNEKMGKNK